jgi:dihydropteroate synthase
MSGDDTNLLQIRDRLLRLDDRFLIVGVLNVTPDSFYDGGKFLTVEAAVRHAIEMAEAGADLIDIGAESSRPGAVPITESEELRRLIPAVEAVANAVSVPLSVDTTKAAVARRALAAGASIVNDVSAGRWDADMFHVVAEAGSGMVLMHMQGTPQTMQQSPQYRDVVHEVRAFLIDRTAAAVRAGVNPSKIILDPGFGFGKLQEHNLALLARLGELATAGRPILVGLSRKSFIGQLVHRPVEDRLFGTAAAVALAIERGARLIRVHDVAVMRDVVTVVQSVLRHAESLSQVSHA